MNARRRLRAYRHALEAELVAAIRLGDFRAARGLAMLVAVARIARKFT